MRQALIDFKIADYNEQLLYAFESDSYFELVTALPESLSSMEQLLSEEKFVSEVSLISLFYKLMSFSNGNSDVLCSLCPKRILLAGEDITISSIMCAVQGET